MKKTCFWAYYICSAVSGAAALLLSLLKIGNDIWFGLILYAVFLIINIPLGYFVSGLLVKIIESIDPDDVDADDCPQELKPLIRKIVRQDSLISRQMSQLKQRQQEFSAITENMAEGLIVSDKSGKLLVMNSHAKNIFGKDITSIFQFDRFEKFLPAVTDALSGKNVVDTFEAEQCIYRVYANPLLTDEGISGCVILIMDITEQEQREIMRREFTSNVSHELKTPLTAIYGVSEILAGGIVKAEDIPRFSKNIFDETGRLINLVNDIIKLSKMDENSIEEEREFISLREVSEKICERLESIAQKKNVTLSVEGDCEKISGIYSIIDEMIYNLTDNGIKYNKNGGFVKIKLASCGDRQTISVEDSGIGIAPQHTPRIFERFYRVDKSHSKLVGGTGLGLSIVKHGANFHKATISVKSEIDKGTEITLGFPSSDEASKI